MQIAKTISVSVLLLMTCSALRGQNSCANTLYDANKSYEEGDFTNLVSHLEPCLKSGFSKDEKVEAYRLVALDYIYLNQPQRADTAVREMLERDHSYKIFPLHLDDPMAFTNIVNSYDVIPFLRVGVKLGFNLGNVNLTSNKGVSNSTAWYQSLIGYQFGVEGDYLILNGLHISTAFQSMGVRYEHDFDNVAGWQQKYTENLTYIHVPISARYYFFKDDAPLRPYIEAGASFDFLSKASANILNTDISTGNTDNTSLNPTSHRNPENTSILYGAGLSYKAGAGWVSFNVRYLYGLSPIVNTSNRYNDIDFFYRYQYIDDDFKLNNWQFTFGYSYPVFYKVEKAKNIVR